MTFILFNNLAFGLQAARVRDHSFVDAKRHEPLHTTICSPLPPCKNLFCAGGRRRKCREVDERRLHAAAPLPAAFRQIDPRPTTSFNIVFALNRMIQAV